MSTDSNTTLNRADIGSLLKQERYYRDSRQWGKLRECYHADDIRTFINISWYRGGIEGFVSGSQKLTSDEISIVHDISPIVIQIGGVKKALAESTGRIYARFTHDGVDLLLTSWVRFFTRLDNVESQGLKVWKMLSLEVIYMFDSLAPIFPQPPEVPLALDFSIVEGARKSYKCVAWHVAQIGVVVRDDLPGDDDPKSVREVENRNYAWITAGPELS